LKYTVQWTAINVDVRIHNVPWHTRGEINNLYLRVYPEEGQKIYSLLLEP